MSNLTIRHRPLDGRWETIGSGRLRGIWPADAVLTANRWGSERATYVLRRRPGSPLPELYADTKVRIEVNGQPVWTGRIKETPETSGRDPLITVEAEGLQYRLDDNKYQRTFVHTRLGDWVDVRGFLSTDLTTWPSAPQVTAGDGQIGIVLPSGQGLANSAKAGVVLDLGPSSVARRVVVGYEKIGGNPGGADLAVRGEDVLPLDGADTYGFVGINGLASGATGTLSGTIAGGHRYVTIFWYVWAGGGITASGDFGVKITSAQVFAETAYESGGASILDSGTVVRDAVAERGGFNSDTSLIEDGTIALPAFAPDAPQSSRAYIEQANAPLGYLAKVDELERVVFRPYDTAPVVDIGDWPGADFAATSTNSSEGIETTVIVRGTSPEGIPLEVVRTQTEQTIIDRQGEVRETVLDSRWPLPSDLTFATALGDARLSSHRVTPLRGAVEVHRGGARRTRGGAEVHPAYLLTLTGDMLRITNRSDPDTGNWGRAGVIDTVTYRHDDETADVALDNSRDNFEALQERLGLLIPA